MTRFLLACSLVVLAAACGDGAAEESSEAAPAARGLCDAIGAAADGDVPGADAAFQDRVHRYLHELANRLSTFDRERSAALLQAKQRVEAALAAGAPGGEVRDSMVTLYGELVTAADTAGSEVPACPEAA